jgi:hypothetical protein
VRTGDRNSEITSRRSAQPSEQDGIKLPSTGGRADISEAVRARRI